MREHDVIPPAEPHAEKDPRPRLRLRVLDSAELFAGGNEVWIEHHGDRYRLQLTRAGKLILTK